MDFFGRIKDAMNRLLASARWETKASGLVAQIIERNGVRGVTVAGPAA